MKSKWAIKELDMLISRRLSVKYRPRIAVMVPVLLEDVEVPALLRDMKYLDLRDGNVSRAVSDLIEAINQDTRASAEKFTEQFIGTGEKLGEILFNLEQRIGESSRLLADLVPSSEFAETVRKWIEDDYARIDDITEMTKTWKEIISLLIHSRV